jgi:acyl phosphate:glycerol-3-phosphate acyltransferase
MNAWRPMFVVGITCSKQIIRASVSRRTWAYQTKSAFSDTTMIAALALNMIRSAAYRAWMLRIKAFCMRYVFRRRPNLPHGLVRSRGS